MDAGVIAVLALVIFAGAILRAAWLVFKACFNVVLDKIQRPTTPRIYYGQPYTLLVCKRRIERTNTHDRYGNHTFVEEVYEEADPDLVEAVELPRLISPRKQLTKR